MEKHQLYGSRWVNVLGGEGDSIERIKIKTIFIFLGSPDPKNLHSSMVYWY